MPKKRGWKMNKIPSIEVDIVDHCNLNCKGCTHFSPIADKSYIDVESFSKDLHRLSEVIPGDCFGTLYILGGEPLLHPDIVRILCISRECYPKQTIKIITNGVLLPQMSDDFWNCCEENGIIIEVTKYPIKYDYGDLKSFVSNRSNKVTIKYKGRTRFLVKKQYRLPLDIYGKQDMEYSFRHCFMGGSCLNLSKGHLYTCSYAAFIERLNKRFDLSFPITQEDGIDIYTESLTANGVLETMSKPIPLCKYCAVKDREYGLKWDTSKRIKEEWLL